MRRFLLAGFSDPQRAALSAALKNAGNLPLACSIDDVVDLVRHDARHVVVLNFSISAVEAWAAATALRAEHPAIALIGLAPSFGAEDKVVWLGVLDRCLPLGGDSRVLLAEVAALARRCDVDRAALVTVGSVVLDGDSESVTVGGAPVRLTSQEFDLLHMLAASAGLCVTKHAIHARLYGERSMSPKIIDVFVCRIRHKLAQAGAPSNFIETIWGRGYLVRHPAASRALAA